MGGLRPSGLHLNKPVVFGILGLALLVFIVSRLYMSGGLTGGIGTGMFLTGNAVQGPLAKSVAAGRGMDKSLNASKLDPVPQLTSDLAIETKEEEFAVTLGDKTINVHVVQTINSKSDLSKALTVFLLHGASFSSQVWLKTKTMEHIASWGHRAIAIDLPGKGKTKEDIGQGQKAEFLSAFITKMGMTKVVIVSPSMSGSYALPYLFQDPQSSTTRAVGYVPIAPVGTNKFTEQYKSSQLPTLIVYGTKDAAGSRTLNDLSVLPQHEVAPIEGAGHACYLNDPDAFHRVLYYFLKKLNT